MKRKSLGINAFLNGIKSVLNLIFPLITFPYVTRVLSVEGIGIYNFSNTYVNYFMLIAGLGISTYAVREGAKYRDTRKKIESFSNEIFSINIFSTLIAYLLLVVSLLIFKNLSKYVLCIIILSFQILFTTIGTEWIYTIYEDYTYITIRSIAFKVLSIFLLFILVRNVNDYLWYATITVIAGVGSNVFNFIHAKSFITIKFTFNLKLRRHLKPILIIFASSIAVSIYVYSDTTILGIIKNDYAVGLYSTSVKIYQIAQSLLTAILTVTIPRLAMLWGKKYTKEYNRLLSKIINFMEILVLPAAVGLIMLSKEIVYIIAGAKYLPATNSLRIISWAVIFSIFSWIFADCVLIPAKRESIVLKNTILTAIENIILNVLFIPLFSYDGASLSTVLSEFSVMLMNAYACKDIIKPILFKKNAVKNFVESVIGCIGIIIICLLCKIGIESIILRTIFSVILSILEYAAILIFLGNNIAMRILKRIIEVLKNNLRL